MLGVMARCAALLVAALHNAGEQPCSCTEVVLEMLQAATPAHTTWQLAGEQHEDDPSASSSNSSGNGSAVLVGLLASGLPAASAAGVLLHASSRACFS